MQNEAAEELLNAAMDMMADFRDDEAEELLEKLIARLKAGMNAQPDDADRYYYWGRALTLLEEQEQALLRFEKALQIQPEHEGSLWETATLLLYELDRPEGAKAIIEQKLLVIQPGYPLYEEALAASETLIRLKTAKPAPQESGDDSTDENTELPM